MTTTAFDDQFTATTERHIAQPYDVAAILRQNIADMEKELQRQRERAETALADIHDLKEIVAQMAVESIDAVEM